jgi:hypothetical protein
VGRTIISRIVISDQIVARAREGWTLSRLWIVGALGGLPNV